jgi:hypothetical protein
MKDGFCYVDARVLLLEAMKADKRGFERKASIRLVEGDPVCGQCQVGSQICV